MSASKKLQEAIVERLLRTQDFVVGNGVLTQFPVAHGLTMHSAPRVAVRAGAAVLVEGVDYDFELIDINTLKIISLVGAPGVNAWTVTVACLRVKAQSGTSKNWLADAIPIVARRPKDITNDIEAAAAKHGLGLYVMPPLPTRAMGDVPFVFFEAADVAVRIIEYPAGNKFNADAYDLMDDIFAALQWQLLGGEILKNPLQIARNPTETAEGMDKQQRHVRIFDARFTATYGFKPPIAA